MSINVPDPFFPNSGKVLAYSDPFLPEVHFFLIDGQICLPEEELTSVVSLFDFAGRSQRIPDRPSRPLYPLVRVCAVVGRASCLWIVMPGSIFLCTSVCPCIWSKRQPWLLIISSIISARKKWFDQLYWRGRNYLHGNNTFIMYLMLHRWIFCKFFISISTTFIINF